MTASDINDCMPFFGRFKNAWSLHLQPILIVKEKQCVCGMLMQFFGLTLLIAYATNNTDRKKQTKNNAHAVSN